MQKINARNGIDTVNHATLVNGMMTRIFDISSSVKGMYSDPNLSLLMILIR